MSDTVKVTISFEAKIRIGCIKEMSKLEFEAWNKKLSDAKGFAQESVAEELLEMTKLRLTNSIVEDLEIDEFSIET